jgi:nucleoside-diphosphate-sugar epimerase
MRVFVTGASGGIGSAVVPELLSAGHEVLGLARSDASARAVAAAGADVLRGELTDLDSLRSGAAQVDGVVHLAFSNDFQNVEQGMAEEGAAVVAIGTALEGSDKPLVFASGTPAVPGRASTEDDPTPVGGPMAGRARTAEYVLELAGRGVRPAAVRLPRSVHEQGVGYGFASILIETARRTGVSGYVGDGSQRWPAVHRRDAAVLFRLALEQAGQTEPAEHGAAVAHAVDDEGDTMLSLAEAIGHELGLPVEPVAPETFGFLGAIFGADQPSSSALTRERFGWHPTHPSLLEDLAAGGYPASR